MLNFIKSIKSPIHTYTLVSLGIFRSCAATSTLTTSSDGIERISLYSDNKATDKTILNKTQKLFQNILKNSILGVTICNS